LDIKKTASTSMLDHTVGSISVN